MSPKSEKKKMTKEKEMSHQRQYKGMKLIPLSAKFFQIKNTQSFTGLTNLATQENRVFMLSPSSLPFSCPSKYLVLT